MYAASARAGVARVFHARRGLHGNAESVEACTEIVNRNPRNLERLRIARKPMGYNLNKPGHTYWHKLFLVKKPRYITAEVRHFENGPVVTASSGEWALKRQLYRYKIQSNNLLGPRLVFCCYTGELVQQIGLRPGLQWVVSRKCGDISAYINVGRVLARRCLEAGICEMEVDPELTGDKCELLIEELRKGNIILSEPLVYKFPTCWSKHWPEKPWEIHE